MLKYYLKITLIRFKKIFIKSDYKGCVYAKSDKNLHKYKKIIFLFNNSEYIHFGDQLFFQPLIYKLKKSNYKVRVITNQSMIFYFKDYAEEIQEFTGDNLIVTRDDMLPIIQKNCRSADYFLINTSSQNIDEPISNFILNKFCDFYNLENVERIISRDDFLDFKKNQRDKFGIHEKKSVIILNNYIDSGKFRISRKRKKLLIEKLVMNKKEGDFVVHLGSSKDKEKDTNDYSSIVDLDLRGKTSIEDLFIILSLNNISSVFCFDTLIMHISNIYSKKIFLIFRRFYGINESEQKIKAYKNIFNKDESNIELL